MIVIPQNSGISLVRQPEHAALAARMGRAWRRPRRIPESTWSRFLEAVRIHDDGWAEAERHPAVAPDGRPRDFKSLPLAEHAEVWQRSVEHARRRDPYAGLLVAMHAEWLYVHHVRKESGEEHALRLALIQQLLSFQIEAAATLRRGPPEERDAARPERAHAAQRLLTFLDSLSLFALGTVPAFTSGDPLEFGGERAALSVEGYGNGACVSPWPFEEEKVALEYRRVDLDCSSYRDPAALARAMTEASEKVTRSTLRPRPLKEEAETGPLNVSKGLQGLG